MEKYRVWIYPQSIWEDEILFFANTLEEANRMLETLEKYDDELVKRNYKKRAITGIAKYDDDSKSWRYLKKEGNAYIDKYEI